MEPQLDCVVRLKSGGLRSVPTDRIVVSRTLHNTKLVNDG